MAKSKTKEKSPKIDLDLKIYPEEKNKFKERLDLVLFGFSHNFPFWAVLSERCKYSLTKNPFVCPTAGVDKNGHIFFNYHFVETLSNEQLLFLVAHEICHFVFEHSLRLDNRDHEIWNVAADYAINLMLHYQFNNSAFKIPDTVFDESWKNHDQKTHKYYGMVAEAIYDDIKNDQNNPWIKALKNKKGLKDIVFEFGDGDGENIRDRRIPLPDKGNKPEDKYSQEIRDYIRKALTEAFVLSKSQGNMPGNLERLIQGLLKPKINWLNALKQRIRMGVTRLEKRDYSWSTPNRRFMDGEFIYPSPLGPESPKIVYAIDTSCSMSEEDITRAVTELEEIRRKFNARIYFLDCDASVHSSRWIGPHEPLPKLGGGGGTDFRPVFDHLNEKKIKPDYCVFFTDGYGEFGEAQKHLNVLWVLTSDVQPPFGEIIRYNSL